MAKDLIIINVTNFINALQLPITQHIRIVVSLLSFWLYNTCYMRIPDTPEYAQFNDEKIYI